LTSQEKFYVSNDKVILPGAEHPLKVFLQVRVCFSELSSMLVLVTGPWCLVACCHSPRRGVARTGKQTACVPVVAPTHLSRHGASTMIQD
jgi:hypothetical protein